MNYYKKYLKYKAKYIELKNTQIIGGGGKKPPVPVKLKTLDRSGSYIEVTKKTALDEIKKNINYLNNILTTSIDAEILATAFAIDGSLLGRYGSTMISSKDSKGKQVDITASTSKYLCHIAVNQNPAALYYTDGDYVQEDKDFIIELLKGNGMILRYIQFPRDLQDKAIILAAVTQNPEAIQFARPQIKKQIESCIVDKIIDLTKSINDRYYDDSNMDFLRRNGLPDPDFPKIFKKIPLALQYTTDDFQQDVKNVYAALMVNKEVLKILRKDFEYNKDEDFVLRIIPYVGGVEALNFASNKLKTNKKVILAAINNNAAAYDLITDPTLKEDTDILAAKNKPRPVAILGPRPNPTLGPGPRPLSIQF